MRLSIIRNLGKISISILSITGVLSIIIMIAFSFILKDKDNSLLNDRNIKISDDYAKKFEIYINYTTSNLQFAKGFSQRFDIFNSTLDDYIRLSALNSSEIFSVINNVRIHYNVSDIDRKRYEERMSFLLNKNISFTDLLPDGTQKISPIRPWYCPVLFQTPIITSYRPGLDLCQIESTRLIINELTQTNRMIVEPRFSVILKVVLLDFLETIPGGFIYLTIAIDGILKSIIRESEKINLYKNGKMFFNNCKLNECQNYSNNQRMITLPNGELISMVILFPVVNSIYKILYILLGVVLIYICIFLIVINVEAQKNKFIIVDRMLGYVNHEIRNPLNSINGLIEICLIKLEAQRELFNKNLDSKNIAIIQKPRDKNEENEDENIIYSKHSELESNLYTAKRACDMLTHIVNDILDLKRIKDGKLVITKININIRDFMGNLEKILLPKLNEVPDVEFIFENPDKIKTVYFDDQRLLQILLNFLTNSLKFTEFGSITLRIEKIPDGLYKISVTDTGRGIPEKNFKNIFKPFEQSDIENSLRQGGIGLGLYLCKMIIDQTGDKIGFDSELGIGSTFWIIFDNKCE